MRKYWKISNPQSTLVSILESELKIHSVLAKLLANRGIKNCQQAKDFLSSDLSSLIAPSKLEGMELAVLRIKEAITRKERILIYSDYDVDGVSSCAIIETVLKKISAQVMHYIPHRIKDGYGLNKSIVKVCLDNNIGIVIALDCGTSDKEVVEILKENKIDCIVVDHHHPVSGNLASPYSLVNPKLKGSKYEFKDMAAVGLAFKLAWALRGELPEDLLDLACLGTVADVVPLTGENRIIVKEGLRHLKNTTRPGLLALLKLNRLDGQELSPFHISFILAPRINASGRVDTASAALDLLLCEDSSIACNLANNLNKHNQLRQRLESDVFEEALNKIEREIDFDKQKVIVLHQDGWHLGVIGIVAAKLAERFCRPALVISLDEKDGRGSARSIDSFHIVEALNECSRFLRDFGGHKRAAGFSIEKDNIASFKNSINKFAQSIIKEENLIPVLNIDAEIPLCEADDKLFLGINELVPFGEGNPEPVFCSRGLTLKAKPQQLAKDTLKLLLTDGKATISAVGFGLASLASLIQDNSRIDIAYTVSKDTWQGRNNIVLKIKDLQAF